MASETVWVISQSRVASMPRICASSTLTRSLMNLYEVPPIWHWPEALPVLSVQRRVSVILSLKSVLNRVRPVEKPSRLSQMKPISWLRLFSGLRLELPTMIAGSPPPPVIWPQSSTAARMSGER
ncbi:hypothetical protein D3C84_1053930 [compost metagenome]